MKYRIELRRTAERSLKKLDHKYQNYIYKKLLELGNDPRGRKCKKLTGVKNGYRKVAWPYRILYTIDDSNKVIDVYLIAHRKEAFR